MKQEGDTTCFLNWFNHLYQSKNSKASYFWTDYRDFILKLINYTNKKGVELDLFGIDTELEFRRTAYVLSNFEKKISNTIDSLLSLKYIKNDSITRRTLLNYVNKLHPISKNKHEIDVLNKLKRSLKIGCTICLARDQFMYSNFIQNYDSTHILSFATFGLNHVVTKHDFTKSSPFFRMKYKFDLEGYKSTYDLFSSEIKNKIYRIGKIAFQQNAKKYNIHKRRDYNNIMNDDERKHLEKQLEKERVFRVDLRKHNEFTNLSSQLDYLIVYKSSNYR